MLIILDRDGVINEESTEYIKCPEEWIPIPNSLNAVARLSKAGHTVVVATNQAGVGRGYYTEETLDQIHQKMLDELAACGGRIDAIYFCPHHPDDRCECRKPKPGMLLDIQEDYPDLFDSALFVGDSLRDVQAARAAGCKVVLVRTGNGAATLMRGAPEIEQTMAFQDLDEVANYILSQH